VGPKVVKFVFFHSKLRKQPLAEIFKTKGGAKALPTPMDEALAKNTRIDGANTNSIMFSSVAYCCVKFPDDLFMKSMEEWKTAKDQEFFELQTSPGRSCLQRK